MAVLISAYMYSDSTGNDPTKPVGFQASAYFATKADAVEWASQFPKSLRIRATHLSGRPGVEGIASFDVRFSPDKVTGAVNETGLKRMKRFLDLCGPTEWTAHFTNSYRTEAAFMKALSDAD